MAEEFASSNQSLPLIVSGISDLLETMLSYTGGGIWARASSMNFSRNLTFYSNHAQVYGGGVYAEDSNLYFMGSTFHFNVAVLAGGIIYSQNTTISFTGNNILSCNSAGAYGGAVYSYASSFVFSNTY